jgi:hypothetical protein
MFITRTEKAPRLVNMAALAKKSDAERAAADAADADEDRQDDLDDKADDDADQQVESAKQRLDDLEDKLKQQKKQRKAKSDKAARLPMQAQQRAGMESLKVAQAADALRETEARLRRDLREARKAAAAPLSDQFVETLESGGWVATPGKTSAQAAAVAGAIAGMVTKASYNAPIADGQPRRIMGPLAGTSSLRNMPRGSAIPEYSSITGDADTAAAALSLTREELPIDAAGGWTDSAAAQRPGLPMGAPAGNQDVADQLRLLANAPGISDSARNALIREANAYAAQDFNRGGARGSNHFQPEGSFEGDQPGGTRLNPTSPQRMGMAPGAVQRPYGVDYAAPANPNRRTPDNNMADNSLPNRPSPGTPDTLGPSASSRIGEASATGRQGAWPIGDTGQGLLPVNPHQSTPRGDFGGRYTDQTVGRPVASARPAGRNYAPGDPDSRTFIPQVQDKMAHLKAAGLTEAEAVEVIDFIAKRHVR